MVQKFQSAYHENFDRYIRILSWEDMQVETQKVYEQGSLDDMECSWIAIFFSTLALGSLFDDNLNIKGRERCKQASELIDIAIEQIDGRENDVTIQHCRAAFLISFCLTELGETTASHTWQAVTLSFAVESGLYDKFQFMKSEYSDESMLYHFMMAFHR